MAETDLQLLTTTALGSSQAPLSITLLPGSELSDVENLKLTYNVTNFDDKTMIVQLNLATPGLVSIEDEKDLLVVNFTDLNYFKSVHQIRTNVTNLIIEMKK